MFERFTGEARAIVVAAQEHARRLGHSFIGCEHLLLAVCGSAEPAGAALRAHGVTPARVESEIVRLAGAGRTGDLLSGLDRAALAWIGIDLETVRARIEERFGPGALSQPVPARRLSRPARLFGWRGRRERKRRDCQPAAAAGSPVRRHLPFSPRAKKSLQCSLREAVAMRSGYIGAEHLALALVAMGNSPVSAILAALGVSPAPLRAAVLHRYRQAG